ncbi:MAG: hypothetical protein ABUS57_08295 [Pseudomonadota bacterium]
MAETRCAHLRLICLFSVCYSYAEGPSGGTSKSTEANVNVRQGFARLARVAAIAYLLCAVVGIGFTAQEGYAEYPSMLRINDVEFTPTHARLQVRAENDDQLRVILQKLCRGEQGGNCNHLQSRALPIDRGYWALHVWQRTWPTALGWLIVYGFLWAVFRAIRWVALGFMEKSPAN